jgi:hypothetical protein
MLGIVCNVVVNPANPFSMALFTWASDVCNARMLAKVVANTKLMLFAKAGRIRYDSLATTSSFLTTSFGSENRFFE